MNMVKTTVADLKNREISNDLNEAVSTKVASKAEHFSNVAETSRALSEKGQFEEWGPFLTTHIWFLHCS